MHVAGKAYRSLMSMVKDTVYLTCTLAPMRVIWVYLRDRLGSSARGRKYNSAKEEFIASTRHLEFTSDWFTTHISQWLWLFDQYEIASKKQLSILEIGSYEGRSATFLLKTLEHATLTCVDSWDDTVYRQRGRDIDPEHMPRVEARFDRNIADYNDRIHKLKMTSIAYFSERKEAGLFDIIYVDGPHYCDDVLVDAIHCFDLLKVGGFLIFDDYLWRVYDRSLDNPAAAINSVLRLKKGMYDLVGVGAQLTIRKTASSF